VGGVALLSGLIWGAFKVAREDVPAPIANAMRPKTDKPPASTPKGPVGPALAPHAAVEVKPTKRVQGQTPRALPAPAHPDPAPPHPAVTTPGPIRNFTLAPNPGRVEVYLDGVLQPAFNWWRDHLSVEWKGVHKVELRNDVCCERFIAEFGPELPSKNVDLDNDKIIAVLPRKIGNVTIKLQPPRDDVQIELRELGDSPGAMQPLPAKNGDPVPIRFDANGELRKTMQVSVYVPDRPVTKKVFEIGAGEKKDVPVPLE
jgi:hypothetical protein